MSKKGTYNASFFNHFATRIHGTDIRFGFLLGTPLEGGMRDVVFAAPTPPLPPAEGEAARKVPKDVAMLLRARSGATSFADWSLEHAAQLRRLLPAGLEPCGCFAVASEASARDLAPLLVPILRGLEEPLVLTIDGAVRAFWQHVGGAKPALRPAQVKAEVHKDALLLWTAMHVDVAMPGDADADADALATRVERQLLSRLEACAVGVATSDGAPLRIVDAGSDEATGAVAPREAPELRCEFLHGGAGLVVAPEVLGRPCVRQRCLVVATAVMLRRSGEFRGALRRLRADLAASAGERLRLALEEARAAAEPEPPVAKPRGLHLPWRALARPSALASLPIWCGDHCFPDEDRAAAQGRIGELLGIPIDALGPPPAHLDEQARLERDAPGSYAGAPWEGRSSAAKARGAALAVTPACAAAAAALASALLVPLVFRMQ